MYIHDILTQMEEKINILYAEDNTTAAMIYTEILEEAGYTVTLAKEGKQGMATIRNRSLGSPVA